MSSNAERSWNWLKSITFVFGHHCWICAERFLEGDSEWCTARDHEAYVGRCFRSSWEQRKNIVPHAEQIPFKWGSSSSILKTALPPGIVASKQLSLHSAALWQPPEVSLGEAPCSAMCLLAWHRGAELCHSHPLPTWFLPLPSPLHFIPPTPYLLYPSLFTAGQCWLHASTEQWWGSALTGTSSSSSPSATNDTFSTPSASSKLIPLVLNSSGLGSRSSQK